MVARSVSPTTGRESQGTDAEPLSPTSAAAAAATAASPPGANSNSSAVLSPVPTPTKLKSSAITAPPPPAATTTAAAPAPCQTSSSSPPSELKVGLNNQEPAPTCNPAMLALPSCAAASKPAVLAVAESGLEGGVRGGAATAPAAGAVGASGQGVESGGSGGGGGSNSNSSGGGDGTTVDEPSLAPPGQGEEAAAAAAAGPPRRGRNGVSLQLDKEELLPPADPPVMPPSACTTPAGSPRANPGGMADTMMSPPASPWPPNSAKVDGNGNVSGGGRAAAAAGSRARGENGHDGNRYRGAGGVFCMSPESAKAFSPRVSPRAMMSSPPPGPSAQQRGTNIFAGGGRLEGSDWWKGLDLSPDWSGLPRWRESRKPASSLPSSSTNPSDNDNDNDAPGTRAGHETPDMRRREGGGRGILSPSSSPATAARMSQSYVTLLAAAAAEGTNGRVQARTPGTGRGGAVAGSGVGQDGPLTAEYRLRQLEAENLRLRFRVADLEGQVSVMEDELDRRGVPRPMASNPPHASAGSSVAPDKISSVSRVITTRMGGGVIPVTTPQAKDGGGGGEGRGGGDEAGSETGGGGGGPLLSPRGRGYLARLVLEVCAELEESKSKKAATRAAIGSAVSRMVDGDAMIPQSERLCKVLPKVMETAIKGVRDLDEQVFEQMMRRASKRPTMHAAVPASMSMSLCSPSSSALASPSSNGYGFMMPLGTPARRLSSCVVARDGGGEIFAQSPAPGRPASFFRLVGEPKTPRAGGGSALRRSNSNLKGAGRDSLGRGDNGVSEVVRAASAWDSTPAKVSFNGTRHPKRAGGEQRDDSTASDNGKGNGKSAAKKTPRSGGAGGFFGAGDWLAAAFTPRGALAPDPPVSPWAPAPDAGGDKREEKGATDGEGGVEAGDEGGSFTPPPPPPRAAAETVTTSDKLSFEGSTEEVLRYTIVAKSYLIRSKSKRHGEGGSPIKTLMSPGGTARKVEEGGEEDVRHLTKELLDLKTRYMAATQHWLKTDIVNDEELRMIRAQVFEAIQRKRSELHTEAAAVLRAERLAESPSPRIKKGGMTSTSKDGDGDGDGDGDSGAGGRGQRSAAGDKEAAREEEEANRTIAMLVGTAEFLKFSRLLLLLSEAISVSASVSSAAAGSKPSGVSASSTVAAAGGGSKATRGTISGSGGSGGGGGGAGRSSSSSTSLMPPPPPQQQQHPLCRKL